MNKMTNKMTRRRRLKTLKMMATYESFYGRTSGIKWSRYLGLHYSCAWSLILKMNDMKEEVSREGCRYQQASALEYLALIPT